MFYLLIVIALLGPVIHLMLSKESVTKLRIIELYIIYILFSLVGLGGVYAFTGHFFVPDKIAAYIGWQPGSPFQLEVAFTGLAFGVLGILSVWLRNNFWIAIILADTIFSWGAAYGHIKDIMQHHNYAPGNAGLILYMDILVPAVLIALLIAFYSLKRKGTS